MRTRPPTATKYSAVSDPGHLGTRAEAEGMMPNVNQIASNRLSLALCCRNLSFRLGTDANEIRGFLCGSDRYAPDTLPNSKFGTWGR